MTDREKASAGRIKFAIELLGQAAIVTACFLFGLKTGFAVLGVILLLDSYSISQQLKDK